MMLEEEDVKTNDESDQIKSKQEVQQFSIEILPLVKAAQNQHGLRHGDYQRYRSYCSRRIRRIRKSLNFTSGHRHRYQKKPLTVSVISDPRYLYIPLYSAERAWSMAMELKQDAVTEPRKRHHLIRRLKKANKNAQNLQRLSEECGRCDARTKLEVQAYYDWMNGCVMFELQRWKEALDSFSVSQNVYQKLGGVVSENQQLLYTQRVDEITPSLRYCAYNIGGMPTDVAELMKLRSGAPGADILASKIDEVLAKTGEKVASTLTEVQWKANVIPIKNQLVRIALIKVNQTIAEVGRQESNEEKMKLFEQLMMDCQDAINIIREEMSQEKVDKKQSQKQEQQQANRQLLMEYLTHLKLTQSIQRNLLLVKMLGKSNRKAKPEEFVRIYDILLQHVAELSELTDEDNSDLGEAKHYAAQTFMFKAYRCFYLSESYAVMKKWSESIALLSRAEEHVIQAIGLYSDWAKAEGESDLNESRQLQASIKGKKCELQVKGITEIENEDDQLTNELAFSEKPLTESLDTFNPSVSCKNVSLSSIPPDFKAVVGKPLFFDLALDYIEFPSVTHRAEKKAGGLTGFVKGLFWGRN